jgi:AAA+ ATPase superfamily predicted ATPase
MKLIGREEEIRKLDRLLESKEPEFLALYGRRRIGKTFLIEQHFKRQLCFQLVGQKDGTLKEQLDNFDQALGKHSRKKRSCPGSWQEAFQQLEGHLRTLTGRSKRVIFLDELPWLAGPRSRFLPALDHFWNSFISKNPRFIRN